MHAQDIDHRYSTEIKDQLIIKSNSKYEVKYFYKNNLYKKKELHKVLKQDPLAWNMYKKYKSNKSDAPIFYVTSLSLFVGTYIAGANNNESKSDFALAAGFLSSIAMAGIGIRSSLKSRKDFDKSIEYFNGNVINKESLGSAPIQLNLQYSGNGFGLILSY